MREDTAAAVVNWSIARVLCVCILLVRVHCLIQVLVAGLVARASRADKCIINPVLFLKLEVHRVHGGDLLITVARHALLPCVDIVSCEVGIGAPPWQVYSRSITVVYFERNVGVVHAVHRLDPSC
jgi:hypothetical protein